MAFPRKMSRLVLLTAVVLIVMLVMHLMPGEPPATSSPSAPAPAANPKAPSQGERSPKDAQAPIDDASSSSSSKFDWSKAPQFFPPKSIKAMPTGQPLKMPQVQASPDAFEQSAETEQRREAVRDTFKKSYKAYKEYAWMHDEVTPVSGGFKNPFGGWAATLVDTLDTLYIMDLKDEFRVAAKAVNNIDWSVTDAGAANMFETTIRHLGGLLSAYDLSGDNTLLTKAIELAEMLYHGFDTPNRMPGFWMNFKEAKNGELLAGTNDPSASPASLCVEFTRLAQITGNDKYYDATDRVTRFLEKTQQKTLLPGMWPIALDFRNLAVKDNRFTLGALADSLYEYLPKMHALMGGVDDVYEKMYRTAMDTVVKHLLFRPMLPDGKDILFTGDYHATSRNKFTPESQHLTCFVGGMFGLGGKLFGIDEHVSIGERLARGCGWAYSVFPTGVMPEIFRLVPCKDMNDCPWDEERYGSLGSTTLPKGFSDARDPQYQLRPEAIESIFIMYRITGKKELQDIAWQMFQSILKSTETKLAYSAISDVTVTGETKKVDSMEVSLLFPDVVHLRTVDPQWWRMFVGVIGTNLTSVYRAFG